MLAYHWYMMYKHSFYLIDIYDDSIISDVITLISIVQEKRKSERISVIDEAHFSDDLIQYVQDTFSWIPNFDHNNYGLDYHGVTLFPSSSF